jgi:hypothetical protein
MCQQAVGGSVLGSPLTARFTSTSSNSTPRVRMTETTLVEIHLTSPPVHRHTTTVAGSWHVDGMFSAR